MSCTISILKGEVLSSVTGKVGDDEVRFKTVDGKTYRLYHDQDCCESITLSDIVGDLNDLVGAPILMAEEAVSRSGETCDLPAKDEYDDSYTWTFYKLATIKGYVTLKFYGASNGWYSESVDFEECK